MHVPDGYLDAPASVATGVIALAGFTLAMRHLRREHPADDRVPMAGLVAAFIFAAQMVNFSVGGGTSGHLMGGALAAVLLGPATAIVCLSGVLIVQALFFADGGLTALGTNITLLALVGVLVGWLVFLAVTAVLPRSSVSVCLGAVAGAFVSVPVAATVFAALFAMAGTAPVEIGQVFMAMVGWHALIGIGEAAISGLVVAAVLTVRPDLVYGGRRRLLSGRGHKVMA